MIELRLLSLVAGTGAEVTYTHTSLGPAGDAFIEGFTDEYYGRFMRDWEARLNHFLSTGNKLLALHG